MRENGNCKLLIYRFFMLHYHFIGLKGIGMSALAQYYQNQGIKITGSDAAAGGHSGENITSDIDRVIYSAAIPENNCELKKARCLKISCLSYAQALGELTKKYFTIAVSGMHGKSTTASLIALIATRAGLNPTVIVGTKIKEFDFSNFRLGGKPSFSGLKISSRLKSEIFQKQLLIIEADEYKASFLNYWPRILVLLNLEREHLDYYKDLRQIKKTFGQYIGHLGMDDYLIVNRDNSYLVELAEKYNCGRTIFFNPSRKILGSHFQIPGRHILADAQAALAVANVLGIPRKISQAALNDFRGVWRRFDFRRKINGANVFDDYGHHPTEIKATLQAAREILPKNKCLWIVFQPHQYLRTYLLFQDFVKCFDESDRLILVPIYSVSGRESIEIKKKVSSRELAVAVKKRWVKKFPQKKVFYFSLSQVSSFLKKNLKSGDVCLLMGAGDIYSRVKF